MPKVRDFAAGLARAGKTLKKIKGMAGEACSDQVLKRMQIYEIMDILEGGEKTEVQRHLSAKKTKRTVNLVATVAAAAINAFYIVKVLGTFTRI